MTVFDRFPQTCVRLRAAAALPVLAALDAAGGTLAMLTRIDGRFYRPEGAVMAILPDGTLIGQLTGGCIEGDLVLHAQALPPGDPALTLRYGRGSPFMDIRLPCGSGIEVTLARFAPGAFTGTLASLAARKVTQLALAGFPRLDILPQTRIALFGEGAEMAHFTRLATAADLQIIHPAHPAQGGRMQLDAYSAVLLLFHDHHREIAILRAALETPAFWIGAQGSRTVHARRQQDLRALGLGPAQLARLRGPIGLIPDARDPVTLAISVLAEITAAQP